MGGFVLTSPEAVGIRRESIEEFLAQCRRKGLELHRLMILRHGKCCVKMTWAPYSEDDLHPLYSFSKSLTATAIGFARQEGLLSLDEKIADIFPEELPEHPSENLKECTIHHLLCMSCGQETEIRDSGEDWLKHFFAHPFLHRPGTFYKYNTAGTNVLAAIIRKRTGQQVTEYLKPRLFEPLGMGDVPCAALPDTTRTQIGGAGMKMRLEDMARFTQFMLQDGMWEGKVLLKDWFSARAGIKQMETAGDSEGHIEDWAQGYGYQCWMGKRPGSFRADGAFGQFGLVYPDLDLCVIISAATEQTQTLLDKVNDCLLPGVGAVSDNEPADSKLPVEEADQETAPGSAAEEADQENALRGAIIRRYALPALQSCRNPVREKKLEGAVYRTDFPEQMAGIQRMIGGAGLFGVPDDRHIGSLSFDFGEDEVRLMLTEDGIEKTLTCALDGTFALSEIDGIRYAAAARWRSLTKLEAEIRRLDAMSGVRLIFCFEDDLLRMDADDTLMTDGGLGMVYRPLTYFREA